MHPSDRTAPSASRGEHVCRLVDGVGGFRQAALAFLDEGIGRRERLVYLADRPVADLAVDIAPLGDVERLVARGALTIESTHALYAPGGDIGFDAGRQVGRYRHLTEQALRDGYAGLRVAADATALVATTDARRRFMRYEVAVDRLMTEVPMSAMCAYDVTALGPGAGELCAVHPSDDAPSEATPGFRLWFGTDGLCLAGEIDIINRDLFWLALEAAVGCTDERVLLDTSALRFIDVGGIVALGQLQRSLVAAGRDLQLVNASAGVRRCVNLLDLDAMLDTPPRTARSIS